MTSHHKDWIQLARSVARLVLPVMFLLVALFLALRERQWSGQDPAEAEGDVYDPLSYYEFVNAEVAPDLVFCPLVDDPRVASSLVSSDLGSAADDWLLDSILGDKADNEAIGADHRKGQALPGEAPPAPPNPDGTCSCGDLRLSPYFCIAPDLSPERSERVAAYVDRSRLTTDLYHLDRWKFQPSTEEGSGSSRGIFRLRTGVHRQLVFPAGRQQRFSGRVLYEESRALPTLVDDLGNEYLLSGQRGRERCVQLSHLREALREVRDERRGPTRIFLDAALLRLQPDCTDSQDSLLVVVNGADTDLLLLAADQTKASASLRATIDGVPLFKSTKRSVVGLRSGQVLQITDRDHPDATISLRFTRRESGVISEMRRGATREQRFTDPDAGLSDLVQSLVVAQDGLISRFDEASSTCTECRDSDAAEKLSAVDIRLTLDEVLQQTTTSALRRYMEHGRVASSSLAIHYDRRNGLWWDSAVDAPALAPSGSLIIADLEGEILAMASYPTARDLERQLDALDDLQGDYPLYLLKKDLQGELRRTSLHLRPHTIGSIFKPLLAWGAGRYGDGSLLDFTVSSTHEVDWRWSGNGRVSNSMLAQCMVDTRHSTGDESRSHFRQAFFQPGIRTSCRGQPSTNGDREDLCMAIAASDTYFFLELGARMSAVARGLPLDSQPSTDPYRLAETCESQVLTRASDGARTRVCKAGKGKSVPMRNWFPATCESSSSNPFCQVAGTYGIWMQAVGEPDVPGTAGSFLGPLHDLTAGYAAQMGLQEGCGPFADWLAQNEMGYRWVVPDPPHWTTDLMDGCTPDFEVFIQGGHINFWNNVFVAQSFARLLADSPRLDLRLVSQIKTGGKWSPGGAGQGSPLQPPACDSPPSSARCRILLGMRQAVQVGTLWRLSATEKAINTDYEGEYRVTLRGKTGTGRVRAPAYRKRRNVDTPDLLRWGRSRVYRKSVHTALLVHVEAADGFSSRDFVVYLWIEGVADNLTSVSAAAPFFHVDSPGDEVLRELVKSLQLPGGTR